MKGIKNECQLMESFFFFFLFSKFKIQVSNLGFDVAGLPVCQLF